jgi:hypothetical protein
MFWTLRVPCGEHCSAIAHQCGASEARVFSRETPREGKRPAYIKQWRAAVDFLACAAVDFFAHAVQILSRLFRLLKRFLVYRWQRFAIENSFVISHIWLRIPLTTFCDLA